VLPRPRGAPRDRSRVSGVYPGSASSPILPILRHRRMNNLRSINPEPCYEPFHPPCRSQTQVHMASNAHRVLLAAHKLDQNSVSGNPGRSPRPGTMITPTTLSSRQLPSGWSASCGRPALAKCSGNCDPYPDDGDVLNHPPFTRVLNLVSTAVAAVGAWRCHAPGVSTFST
jgi:hypothetical protein